MPKPKPKKMGMPQGERVEEKGLKGRQASGSGSRKSTGKDAVTPQPRGAMEKKGARETPKGGRA